MLVTDLIKHIERDVKYSIWIPTTPSGWMMNRLQYTKFEDLEGLEVDWIDVSRTKETSGEIQINTKYKED